MKIKKFHQSCLLVTIDNVNILVDPGNIGYEDFLMDKYYKDINYILITHKHEDHCLESCVNEIVQRDGAMVFTTNEVMKAYKLENVTCVKQGDRLEIGDITIEITKAFHGYLPKMKNDEIKENVGFIIDDKKTRLYITSDSISFNNDYTADVVCMPFNGNGLTFGAYDGTLFAKDIYPKLVIITHTEHALELMKPDMDNIDKYMKENKLQYKLLDLYEQIEV